MKTAIRTKNLSKVYGPVKAVDQLDLVVPRGIIFGFLGANGAGKTTTIRLLTGLIKPTDGEAWVDGEPISNKGGLPNKIGYLPEEPAFYSWMTPLEFLDYIGRLFKIPEKERKARIHQLIEQLDLGAARKRRIGGFSRGMRQRLGLAQALINRPPILLLDEPASALDPNGRKEVLEMITGLRGTHTVFMSTHILADAERVCDRIAIIDQGKILVEADQSTLLSNYTIPAYEIECLPEETSNFQKWAAGLHPLPWVVDVHVDGNLARITVKDPALANQALLSMIVESGVKLIRYEIVRPSLEDIFLRIVGKEGP